MLSQPSLSGTGQILLGILVTVAAIYDIRWRRIPNWLCLAGIVAGLVFHFVVSGFPGLVQSLAGLGLGFILYFPFYLLRALGAGDVKLMAAIGAVIGAMNCLWVFFLTAVLGGVIALLWVAIRGRMKKTLFNVSYILSDLLKFRAPYKSSEELDVKSNKGERLPHGVLMFVGSVAFVVMVQYRITI